MPSLQPNHLLAHALQAGRCRDPFSHLGPHRDAAHGWVVRAFLPGATAVRVLAADGGAVLAHLAERLAGYKLPASVTFVEAVPKSASGKILRRVLRERVAESA